MRILRLSYMALVFVLLTLFTQVGGLAYLLFVFTKKLVFGTKPRYPFTAYLLALGYYCLISFAITPIVAKQFGRVPLPWQSHPDFPSHPASWLTCFANRHYVTPELYRTYQQVAYKYQQRYPNAVLVYLDANFPFFDGFPLLPHRSHDDGEKLDIAFRYRNTQNQIVNRAPSFLGYGYCESALPNEINTAQRCAARGYWQYSLPTYFVRQHRSDFQFDPQATRALLQLLAAEPSIKKIFLEPHLKSRLGLSDQKKIRFHGCAAVRHDDHIHIQL